MTSISDPFHQISPSSVHEGKRARRDYGDLTGLKDSILRLGSIHPIVLSRRADGEFDLVAGGRRFRSFKELGAKVLTHRSILVPGEFGFLFRDEIPEDQLREAELDENLYRLKPKWQEDVALVADVHALKRKIHGTGKWGLQQTSELLGASYGTANVSYCVRLAKLIAKGDKAILECATMTDAIAVMVKRAEDSALSEMQRRVSSKVSPLLGGNGSNVLETFTPLDLTEKPKSTPSETAQLNSLLNLISKPKPSPATPVAPPSPSAPITIPLSSMFRHGDMRDILPTLPDESFDHIVTDIPYGIDMDNLSAKQVTDVRETHDVEENLSLMPVFLSQAFRIIKPGGFCVFFYDLDHHEKLQTWARDFGFKVQRWPLIWYKTHQCQNNAAQYNFTKNFEVAMVLRKDSNTVLRKVATSSIWMGDGAAERKLYNNPFAKPFALWKELIFDNIAFPKQTVLDPFWGEGSSSRAAANCGLIPYGIEISEQHYNRGIEHMRGVYSLIHHSNVIFT